MNFGGEFNAARLLDLSGSVDWWLRNDPPLLQSQRLSATSSRILCYRIRRSNIITMGILEIKGEIFWDGEGFRKAH